MGFTDRRLIAEGLGAAILGATVVGSGNSPEEIKQLPFSATHCPEALV
jgi:hypothetical protein